jgi:hypothetical protein
VCVCVCVCVYLHACVWLPNVLACARARLGLCVCVGVRALVASQRRPLPGPPHYGGPPHCKGSAAGTDRAGLCRQGGRASRLSASQPRSCSVTWVTALQTDDMTEVQRQKTLRMAWFLPASRRMMAGIRTGDDAASVRVCLRACVRACVRACMRGMSFETDRAAPAMEVEEYADRRVRRVPASRRVRQSRRGRWEG